jgi:hypothetical protein
LQEAGVLGNILEFCLLLSADKSRATLAEEKWEVSDQYAEANLWFPYFFLNLNT